MDVTVIIPTFNEASNVCGLASRIAAAIGGRVAEIVFVDDSTDATPDVIREAAAHSSVPIRLIHREKPVGGLSSAVLVGIASSTAEWCVVMDGDLQHPPELIPVLLASGAEQNADVVVASRHLDGGSATGLDNRLRRLVSNGSTVLTRAMFPIKLRDVTDPMTGFFALRRECIDMSVLRPRGFKILLEILARTALVVVEEPFVFGKRESGSSKATLGQGLRFIAQLGALRFGRLSGFAVVGAIGAIVNVAIMGVLQAVGIWYLSAAIAAAVLTIVGNFMLLERFVFHDLRDGNRSGWIRFVQSLAFNGTETAVRTTALFLIVEALPIPSLLVQALLVAVGFVLRFVYHARVVYKPARTTDPHPSVVRSPSASSEHLLPLRACHSRCR